MTALAVGTNPVELAGAPASRAAAPADPDAFAAELASAASAEKHSESPAGAATDPTPVSPSETRSDAATSVATPTGDRRDRRHPIPGATADAATPTADASDASPVTPIITADLTTILPNTLPSAGDPASAADGTAAAETAAGATGSVGGAVALFTGPSAAVAASETLGAAPSPSAAAPSTPFEWQARPAATSAPAFGSPSGPAGTTPATPAAPAAPMTPQDAVPSAAAGVSTSGAPDAGRLATDPVTASAETPSAPTVAATLAASEPESEPPARPGSKIPGARSADSATLPGAITVSPTSSTTTTAAAAPTGPVAPPAPPLNAQLAPTLFHLRSAEAGTHVLTLTVAPEAVGPVTVRAHVGADGIRIELSAPTAQGRSALDAMLPDLRRDLSQGGMTSTLSLAAANSDGSTSGRSPSDGTTGSFAGDRGADRNPSMPASPAAGESLSTPLAASVPTHLRSGAIALDVFA